MQILRGQNKKEIFSFPNGRVVVIDKENEDLTGRAKTFSFAKDYFKSEELFAALTLKKDKGEAELAKLKLVNGKKWFPITHFAMELNDGRYLVCKN